MTPCFSRSVRSRRSTSTTSGRPVSADRLACAHRPAAPRDLLLRQPDPHVGGHGDVHHLRIGQVELAHQLDVLVDRLDLQARIECLLLADGGDRLALVVVSREHHGLVGQPQQLVEDRVVLRARIAVLEVGAAGAADQQGIAGEHAIAHHEAVGIVGVPGSVEHVERQSFDREPVARRRAASIPRRPCCARPSR